MYFIFQQHWVQGSNLIILSNFIISSNHKTSPSPCLYSSTAHSAWPSSHVFTSLVTSITEVTSLNTSLLDSSLNPIFSNILILAMFSILIFTSYLLIPNFSTPYLSMSSMASHPIFFPLASISAIMISASAHPSPLRNKLVSPTIEEISPLLCKLSLLRTMKVHLSLSSLQFFCISFSCSKVSGSDPVSSCNSSDFIHLWYLSTWASL